MLLTGALLVVKNLTFESDTRLNLKADEFELLPMIGTNHLFAGTC